jgi:hypothetical protein
MAAQPFNCVGNSSRPALHAPCGLYGLEVHIPFSLSKTLATFNDIDSILDTGEKPPVGLLVIHQISGTTTISLTCMQQNYE